MLPLVAQKMRQKLGNRGEKTLIAPELYLVPNVRFGTERRVEMRSCSYDRVFPISSRPGNDNRRNPEQKIGLSKISIAWWLVPAVVVWATSALVFG
jgi:hypothetical protein